VPSTSSEKKKGHSTTLVQLAIKKLILSKECLDGKLELGIPWNPLAMSTIEMENCQKNLHRLSSWSKDKEEQAGQLDRHKTLSYSREKFQKSGIHGEDVKFLKVRQCRKSSACSVYSLVGRKRQTKSFAFCGLFFRFFSCFLIQQFKLDIF